MIELAFDGLFRADFESMRDWARAALGGARPLGDRPLTATAAACSRRSAKRVRRARSPEAEARRGEALGAGRRDARRGARRRGSTPPPTSPPRSSTSTATTRPSRTPSARSTSAARPASCHPTLVPTLVTAHFMRGRLAEAASVLDGGVEAARLAGITAGHGVDAASTARCWRVAAGDARRARSRMAEEALELHASGSTRASSRRGRRWPSPPRRCRRATPRAPSRCSSRGRRRGAAADPRRLAG